MENLQKIFYVKLRSIGDCVDMPWEQFTVTSFRKDSPRFCFVTLSPQIWPSTSNKPCNLQSVIVLLCVEHKWLKKVCPPEDDRRKRKCFLIYPTETDNLFLKLNRSVSEVHKMTIDHLTAKHSTCNYSYWIANDTVTLIQFRHWNKQTWMRTWVKFRLSIREIY